jgi:arylsulfatase A-like enzyme
MKIFLIIFDTLRKDHTGKTYGNEWIRTPNFDTFARDCVVFDKAYPESLPTIPVRRTIHTGARTFPFTQKMPDLRSDDVVISPGWQPIPSNQKHLSEYMNSHGYLTAFITSTYHQFKPNMNFHLGYDQWNWIRGHEDDHYRTRLREDKGSLSKLVKQHVVKKNLVAKAFQKRILKSYFPNVQDREKEKDFFPAKTFNKALEFIKDAKPVKKVFCVIDEFDPHEPWDPPQQFLDLYLDKDYSGKKIITPAYSLTKNYLSGDELKCMRACYAGEVSMCDYWFGNFIEQLKQMELYEDSFIILTSDHGHSIGEHDAIGKIPMFMHPELVDVPLMMKPPGGIDGPKRISKTYVYHHDISATILGLVSKSVPEQFEGIDLSFFFDNPDQPLQNRDYITCGFENFTLYKDDIYALITSNDKKAQKLYDLTTDPSWNDNIAMDHPEICEELFKKIEKDAKGKLYLGNSIYEELYKSIYVTDTKNK